MRKSGLVIIFSAVALLILLPIILVSLILVESSMQVGMAFFFRDTFFTVIPVLLLIGLSLFFFEKISVTEGKTLRIADFFWFIVALLGLGLFFLTTLARPDSIFHNVDSILPFLEVLMPDLYTFTLFTSFGIVVLGSIFVYRALTRTGMDSALIGGGLIGLLIPLLFLILLVKSPILRPLEELFDSYRYSWMRNPGGTIDPQSGLRYCQPPADVTGQQVVTRAPLPPGVRDDIVILGISNVSIEKVGGNWPLDWGIYAQLTDLFSGADASILLFDVSFLDERGVFGGASCGVLFDCTPKAGNPLRPQHEILAESIARAENTVIADYPIETTDEARENIANLDRRIELLDEKTALTNVKNGRYADVWARLPVPPIESITDGLDNLGYANILKLESGMNLHVPLVMRVVDTNASSRPGYDPDVDDTFYPGIDLVVAAEYYGVDLQEDIDIDFLSGEITINNIPERTRPNLFYEDVDIMARPNQDRSVTIPIDNKGLMHINFRGGRYCFPYREIIETTELSPQDVAGNYQNKIALVAMYYATGVGAARDIHLSPYGDMAGIEHHAYAINTILNQDFISETSDVIDLAILLAVGLFMGLIQPRLKTYMAFILAFVVAVVFILLTLFVTFDMFNIHHVFPSVIIMQFLILAGFIGFRVLTEEENVKFIRNTFSKFVSQDVVDELLNNPDAIALGGAKREITVFFSDVRGFTSISEALGPEELVHLLNEYLEVMTELIIDYRGTVDKYMGDAVMAFWGAPADNDDHPYFACVAAIAQVQALKRLQEDWGRRNIPVIDIGCGLNTGLAVVGNMGSSRRMDYTLMGDTVNLGARLETITKTYGVKICISEYTYERVKSRVYARELDLVRVKGKLAPVRIYELMGLRNDSDLEDLKTKP